MFRASWTGVLSAFLLSVCSASAWADRSIPAAPIGGNYKDTQKLLHDLAAKHPENVRMFDLGLSDSGEKIQGAAIGDGSVKNLVVAAHHGNEYGSTEVAKGFATALAASPIPGQTVYVIPVLNIAGYNSRTRWEKAGGRSWDPNRNYPGPCGTEGPFTLKSTTALAKFIEAEGIVSSATLHTFFPAVVYPWGLSSYDLSTPYDDLFLHLTKLATLESGYAVGNSTEIVYAADGTYEDYAFWKHGIWSLLFELGYSHNPNQSAINEMVKVNVPGLRRFLEEAPRERAAEHDFKGRCDNRLKAFDRHDE